MGETLRELFPEVGAGGFTRFDGTVEFYGRVSSLVSPTSRVLDLGAGRASWLDDPIAYRRDLRKLKGRVAEVVGVDIDQAVLTNSSLDKAVLMPAPGVIPLEDSTVDVVVADYVLEHVQNPEALAREIHRVLRPGGWFCARTPNRRGLTGLVARSVPNSAHVPILRRLQPAKAEVDTFPTAYKMNDLDTLRSLFRSPLFRDHSYAYDSEPGYAGNSGVLLRGMSTIKKISPARYKETLMVFFHKAD